MLKRLQPTLGESEQQFLRRSRGRSVLRSTSLAAGLSVVMLVGTFFLWSNSMNLVLGEAVEVLGFKFGLVDISEPEMIQVPAGKLGTEDEGPQREIKVESFEIGKHEVTFDEYDQFANVTGRSKPGDSSWGRGKRPVINVSWEDAVAYAKWLSDKTGRNYCLPTSAEWEYAARAGTKTDWSFGNDEDQLKQYAWYDENSDSKTHPVGTKDPNPWGLYDMHGNVWEWTCSEGSDRYDDSERQCVSGRGEKRVLRGGSWIDYGRLVRSAYRLAYDPGIRSGDFGFRLARGQTGSQCESEPEARQ